MYDNMALNSCLLKSDQNDMEILYLAHTQHPVYDTHNANLKILNPSKLWGFLIAHPHKLHIFKYFYNTSDALKPALNIGEIKRSKKFLPHVIKSTYYHLKLN